MPKYLLVYHGGSMPETEEAGQQSMQNWMAWFETLGAPSSTAAIPWAWRRRCMLAAR